jgi:protein-disulfide isomerase
MNKLPVKVFAWAAVVAAGLGVGAIAGKTLRPLPAGALEAAFAAENAVDPGVSAVPPLGNPNAPIVLTIYSDFECSHCALAAKHVQRLVEDDADVQVRFKNIPSPNHPHGELAARAGLAAANQGKFWPYHDLLFADQAHLERADLLSRARRLGLDMASFERDLADPGVDAGVNADISQGVALKIPGTPTIYINGRRVTGQLHFAGLQRLIDETRRTLSAARSAQTLTR